MRKNPLAIVLILSGVFFVIFVIVAVATVASFSSGTTQKTLFSGGNNVGVIEVKGVIMDSKQLLEDMDEFGENSMIRAVVVRIDSPGGAVAPSQEIYDAVKKLSAKKPVYASMGSIAASGGYYIAVGAKKIFANPGTITGSIGVIMQFADLSRLYQWAKINPYSIKTGKFKDIGSPTREMSADEKALLQDMMENVLGQFRAAIATSRNLPMPKVVAASDGRIFSGEQAKTLKLVDEVGSFTDAVEAVAKEAKIDGKPRLVYPDRRGHLLETLLGSMDEGEGSEGRSSLFERFAREVAAQAFGIKATKSTAKLIGPLYILPYALE